MNSSFIVNPVNVCQSLYGIENVNEVRDAVVDCMRRYYGDSLDQPDIYYMLQTYMIRILQDAGKNPKAVRLAIPPNRLQSNPFPEYYMIHGGNKEIAYEMAVKKVYKMFPYPSQKEALLNIYIDYHSV